MADGDAAVPRAVAPVASVWCRQVDNEAESPGYTTIPEEFPGRRETLETIRTVGNLTVNVADTHDYWDPGPAGSLSFYPNLFLYPAGAGQYTAVGRMFLSTEDRPRLGMKTLVFSTVELLASGDFGGLVLRAYATMDGPSTAPAPGPEVDPSVFPAVGEGFLFHRGATDPVVVVASDLWGPVARTVLDLVRVLPASLVALGAYLVFPYFLPATKVNFHEFTEQLPLALAVMRVPRQEAEGERHAKRMEGWEDQPVTLRDLTRPASTKAKGTLPLMLQYLRDHEEQRAVEVARRVDTVETPSLGPVLADLDHQGGRDRRKEMWRIGTAMETAALVLARPKGRTTKISGESAKRAHEYLGAKPGESPVASSGLTTVPPAPMPPVAPPSAAPAVPGWLQPPPTVVVPKTDGWTVPVPTSDDPSERGAAAPPAPAVAPPAIPILARPSVPAPPPRAAPAAPSPPPPVAAPGRPPALDTLALETRIAVAVREAGAAWSRELEARVAALERRPAPPPPPDRAALEGLTRETVQAAVTPLAAQLADEARRSAEGWAERLRRQLQETTDVLAARAAKSDGELRAALSSQVELEFQKAREQNLASRAELEARARSLLDERLAAAEGDRAKALQDAEARLARLVEEQIRTSGVEGRRTFDERLTAVQQGHERTLADRDERTRALVETKVRDSDSQLRKLFDDRWSEANRAREGAVRESEGRIVRFLESRIAEIDAQQRKALEDRLAEASRAHEQTAQASEARSAGLLEERLKEQEVALQQAWQAALDRATSAADDRIAHAERRAATEREARLAELTETQNAAISGLQVRLEAMVEEKLRAEQTQAQEKYLSLLSRLKTNLEETLQRTLASPTFDATLRERITEELEEVRARQATVFGKLIAEAETAFGRERETAVRRLEGVEQKIGEREAALMAVEEKVRAELAEVDRRLLVVNDHILPLVRQTWLKVSQLEKDDRSKGVQAELAELRKELAEEIARVEQDLAAQTTDLRDRLEASVTSHGRIWLNLLRQISPEGGLPREATPAGHRPARRPLRSLAGSGLMPPPGPEALSEAPAESPPTATQARRRAPRV